jgi:very-short-patch-repair endonuclease
MTHSRGDLLRALSKKLIQLSGNDMINKRLSGKGTGGIFNVCDEIPQFVLNRLMEGKKFKIVGMMEPDDYLLDENTPEFEKAFDRHMDDCGLSEEGLEEDEIRERKDQLRIHLGMTPAHELIPSGHQLELPKSSSSESELKRHTDDKLQTDLSEENLKKCLIKMERERVRFEREKGLQTLYAAFGFLQWQNADEKDFTSPILLMRVNLEKGRGENSYKISASGDLETNQSLSYALLQETRALPPQAEDFVDENGGFDINQMFEAYENFIQKFDSWKVLNRISVGIFKSRGIPFSEILPEGYSEENVTAAEEMLVGRDEMATNSGLRDVDDSESRDLVPSFALNADSSQHAAILEVAEGKDLVIEGPPGTGKSQTIVNLISNALYRGKTVLFLAQKLAALEVVNHRLESIGLGKKCLSLHSEYARKSTLFESIGEKIKAPAPEDKVSKSHFLRIREERDSYLTQLNDHAHQMSRKIFEGDQEETLSEDNLIAHYALTTYAIHQDLVKDEQIPDFNVPPDYDLRNLKSDLSEAASLEELISNADQSNFHLLSFLYYSKIPTPFEIDEIYEKLEVIRESLSKFPENYQAADLLGIESTATNLTQTHKQRVIFEDSEKKLKSLIGSNQRPTSINAVLQREHLGSSPSVGLWISSTLVPWSESAKAKKFFRQIFDMPKGDLSSLQAKASELMNLLQLNETSKKHLQETGYVEVNSGQIEQQLKWLEERTKDLQNAEDFISQVSLSFENHSAAEISRVLQALADAKSSFRELGEINSILHGFEQRIGCGEWLRNLTIAGRSIGNLLEAGLYKFFSKKVSEKSPQIYKFNGKNMDRLRDKFKKAEEDCRSTYVREIASRMPKAEDLPKHKKATKVGDKMGQQLLNHIESVPNARITVRELCFRAIDTLKHYTPCFLMTPSSVADYVPKSTEFDLVIIDEASQMLPEEAIGSILRSKQVVVVGDPKQMPPTRYMQSTLEDEMDQEDDTNYSILDRAMLAFPNFRRLCYHYRSEDESLIRFSNNEFYENDLMTVPNLNQDERLGVKFIDAEGVYNSGKTDLVSVDEHGQTSGWSPSKNPNPIEAQKLVEIILHEIRERPGWSIGVAVMNLKQAIRVEELFQEQIDDTIRAYLNHWKNTPEYFFIKNLENVQGDERDTIIIATVYGKNHEGRMFQRYGPINMEKGENRINVLVTRAKKRVVVCSSMNPNDITAQNSGPQVLRRYLQYAKTGQLEDTSTRNEPDGDHWYDAPWEKWFHDRLETDGYIVNPQVGVSGWRIDLGVMHEDFPNGYLCGVELDGKDHLRQSARDRDIERQAILESKGWTILRVWSIDFFNDMEGEYQILKSAIDEILEKKRVTKVESPEETIEDFMEECNELVKADLLEY